MAPKEDVGGSSSAPVKCGRVAHRSVAAAEVAVAVVVGVARVEETLPRRRRIGKRGVLPLSDLAPPSAATGMSFPFLSLC